MASRGKGEKPDPHWGIKRPVAFNRYLAWFEL